MVEGAQFWDCLGITREGFADIINTPAQRITARRMDKDMVMTMSGPLAERAIHKPRISGLPRTGLSLYLYLHNYGGEVDFESVEKVLEERRALTRRGSMKRVVEAAHRFVDDHSKAIDAIAQDLLAKRTLQAGEIAAAIRRGQPGAVFHKQGAPIPDRYAIELKPAE